MSFQNARIICKSANPDEYHASDIPRGDKAFVVSSSMLRLFNQCPARWRAGYCSPESDAKKFGSLLDTRLLLPEQFSQRFSIQPEKYTTAGMECPVCRSVTDSKKCAKCKTERIEVSIEKDWSGNATECSEWTAKQKADKKEIVTIYDIAEADEARARIMSDETIAEWFASCDKQVWVTADWHDKATGLIIPVRALIDFVPRNDTVFMKSIGDLKAVRSAAQTPFRRQVYQLGWHLQASLYLDMYQMATRTDPMDEQSGEDRNSFIFIIQENYSPFMFGRRLLSLEFLQIGRQTYQGGLQRYARCLKTGAWPAYDAPEEFSIINPEPFMEYEALSDSMEQTQLESAGDDDVAMP